MNSYYKLTIILFLFFINNQTHAQSVKAFEKAGDKAYTAKDYNAALSHYASALQKSPNHLGLSLKYAQAARAFQAFELAKENYQKVLDTEDANRYPLAFWGMAHIQKSLGNYSLAKSFFKKYIAIAGKGKGAFIQKAEAEINACAWAQELVALPDKVKIEQLSKNVNTAYSEFGALQRGDTLYYSSYRFANEKDEHLPPRKITKLLTSIHNSKGRIMCRGFNDKSSHTAHTTFSLDNKRIYFTICHYVGEADIRCAIYYREKDNRNRWKRTAKKLPHFINMEGYTTTHPNIAYDSTLKQEVLYFTSDRPNGKGGLDIWKTSIINIKQGFTRPSNLSTINTAEDEITPFFHNASQTLYFSSNGIQGLGGYDVFKSKRKGTWQPIIHLGYPLNSSYNEVYFSLSEQDTLTALMSSNRLGSFYLDKKNKSCCNDIYKISMFPDETEMTPADSIDLITTNAVLSGNNVPILPTTDPPEIPTTLEDFLPLALYFHNDEPDQSTRRTTTKKTYHDTYKKYYSLKKTYIREFSKPLEEEDQATAEEQLEDFFENEIKKGHDFLQRFSEILLQKLQKGEAVEIFIKGFTSPRAKSDYNLSLGKRRISSLRNHFDSYQNGVFLPFLNKKQLIVTERSFGETKAASSVSDDLVDERNSIYSIGAAKERRVEIVEIKRK